REFRRQASPPRTLRGLSFGLEEGLRQTRSGTEGARVHGDVGERKTHGHEKITPHNSEPALSDPGVPRRHHAPKAGKITDRAAASIGRPQLARPRHLALHR